MAWSAKSWLVLLRHVLRRDVEREPRCVRPTFASQSFDYEHPHRVSLPASLRGSRLAPPLGACAASEGDRGTWRFKAPDPLRWATSGWRAAFVLPRAPCLPNPETPLSRTRVAAPLSRRGDSEPAEIVLRVRSLTIRTRRRPRVPSIASPPRRARIADLPGSGHVMLPLRGWAAASSSSGSHFRT